MTKQCPQKAVLNIKGEHFDCDTMRQMAAESETHDGWPHGSSKAEAIWGETDFNGAIPDKSTEYVDVKYAKLTKEITLHLKEASEVIYEISTHLVTFDNRIAALEDV